MLNAVTPLDRPPLADAGVPGLVPADAESGPGAFALVLEQASARPPAGIPAGIPADVAAEPLQAPANRHARLPAAGDHTPGAAARRVDRVELPEPASEAARLAATGAVTAPRDDTLPPVTPTQDGDDAATAPDPDAAPADLAAWVSSLPLPPPPPAAPAAVAPPQLQVQTQAQVPSAKAGDVVAVAGGEGAARAPGTAAMPAAATATLAGTARRDDVAQGPEPAGPAMAHPAPARDATPAAPRAQSTSIEITATAARPSAETLPPLPPLPAGPIAGEARPMADAVAPAQAEVQAEVGSREFAPALGLQLRVMVRDGIEHAQLKLNPAEMGPIEVRISVDGGQAQVDFSAAQAHTRQALQDAVPVLASALRESGLTLTGGGVFEQPRESRGDAPPGGPRGMAATPRTGDDAAAGPPPHAAHARGVLDLYA